jgi:hypothetical protein
VVEEEDIYGVSDEEQNAEVEAEVAVEVPAEIITRLGH